MHCRSEAEKKLQSKKQQEQEQQDGSAWHVWWTALRLSLVLHSASFSSPFALLHFFFIDYDHLISSLFVHAGYFWFSSWQELLFDLFCSRITSSCHLFQEGRICFFCWVASSNPRSSFCSSPGYSRAVLVDSSSLRVRLLAPPPPPLPAGIPCDRDRGVVVCCPCFSFTFLPSSLPSFILIFVFVLPPPPPPMTAFCFCFPFMLLFFCLSSRSTSTSSASAIVLLVPLVIINGSVS